VELTKRQHETIEAGRRAMRQTIEAEYPLDVVPLYCVAAVGLFSDICRTSLATGELLSIINRELSSAGLQVVKKQRN
jgi:hypothetical protein